MTVGSVGDVGVGHGHGDVGTPKTEGVVQGREIPVGKPAWLVHGDVNGESGFQVLYVEGGATRLLRAITVAKVSRAPALPRR